MMSAGLSPVTSGQDRCPQRNCERNKQDQPFELAAAVVWVDVEEKFDPLRPGDGCGEQDTIRARYNNFEQKSWPKIASHIVANQVIDEPLPVPYQNTSCTTRMISWQLIVT
jgi:hypothetical protein